MMEIRMRPIGYVHSPFKEKKDIPRQNTLAEDQKATIEMLADYREGIEDIQAGSYGIILFYFHQSEGYALKTVSRKTQEYVGVFSTRSPNRPNGIGLSIVKFTKIEGNSIEFQGVDMLDNTPVLDIKPYDPALNPKL